MTKRTSNRILLNASNLHSGGGLQVASSVIYEVSLTDDAGRINVLVSFSVHQNLLDMNCDFSKFAGYEIFNANGISALWSGLIRIIAKYDLVFTIFGPLYVSYFSGINVSGFAQAWIIYPDNDSAKNIPAFVRLKTKLKYLLQAVFFRQADVLVVELEHVKKGLIESGLVRSSKIEVVHNCLSSVYLQPKKWLPLVLQKKNYSIGFVGRDYSHKNTDILPVVKNYLDVKHGLNVDFFVTFTDVEWGKKSIYFRDNIKNVGELAVAQCPTFYEQIDAVIFPSLLECFSATPLEAMAMGRPLFASDRGFVRDICTDFALYFDPLDPESAADCIANYIKNSAGHDCARLDQAREHAFTFSTAHERAAKYLSLIDRALGH